MRHDTLLTRLLDAARQADDPARRVVEALADDPVFALWAADEATRELDTPLTARPGVGELVLHASGSAAQAMVRGVEKVVGSRPLRREGVGARDRFLVLLSPGGDVPDPGRGLRPAACLALVLGTPAPEQRSRLDALGAVVRDLGEDRSVLAVVQRLARDDGYTPVVLHRHLRGSAPAAGRGLARAALAVAGGMGGVPRPACLLMVGELHGGSGEAAEAVRVAAGEALRGGGGGITVGAVAVGGAEDEKRVVGVALVT